MILLLGSFLMHFCPGTDIPDRGNQVSTAIWAGLIFTTHTQHVIHKRDPLSNLTTTRETLVVDVNSVVYKCILKYCRIQEESNPDRKIAGPMT